MQRPAELVPIPRDPLVRREGFGKLRKVAAFWKNPEKFWRKFGRNLAKIRQICKILQKKTAKFSAIFNENFEIPKRCKGVHCVDLGESFPTHIFLQHLASIQLRTSLVKFARSPRTDPPGLSLRNQTQFVGLRAVKYNFRNFYDFFLWYSKERIGTRFPVR